MTGNSKAPRCFAATPFEKGVSRQHCRAAHGRRGAEAGFAVSNQSGAALAVALFLLVVMTLLGLTAIRGSQIALKLAGREQARLDANDSAQSLVDSLILNLNTHFTVGPTQEVAVSCYPAGLAINVEPFYAPFACAAASLSPPVTPESKYEDHSYVQIYREADAGSSAVGAANSFRTGYARFRVTAGFDRSAEGLGSAEITQGLNILTTRPAGMDLSSSGPDTTP